MAHRVLSADTLTSPTRLYNFLDAATRSIQIDRDLNSLGRLIDLAGQLQATDPTHIRFLSAPLEPYAPDPNRLQIAPEAHRLWRLDRRDQPLGAFARKAISADDRVGDPDNEAGTDAARDRVANGLCA